MSRIKVGIDKMSFYIPKLFLDISDYAKERKPEDDNYTGLLQGGLGIKKMAIPDVHEDTATMGANAAYKLIKDNNIDPRKIGKMKLGTESGLDGSKPTATYIQGMLEEKLKDKYGKGCLRHCDVQDSTFACIGGIDALEDTIHWIMAKPERERMGIVITSDPAKYDLGSRGEHTQGAGSVAMIVKKDPKLISFCDIKGVSTRNVGDFIKPRRIEAVKDALGDFAKLANECGIDIDEEKINKMYQHLQESDLKDQGIFRYGTEEWLMHKDEPVFNSDFSNLCYREAMKYAFDHYVKRSIEEDIYNPEDGPITDTLDKIIVHLPYALQGKRIFPFIFRHERRDIPVWKEIEKQIGIEPKREDFPEGEEGDILFEKKDNLYLKELRATEMFKDFYNSKLEGSQLASSEIGNSYTGSIFFAFYSMLEYEFKKNTDLTGMNIGFAAYGSGSKDKVFKGVMQPGWKEIAGYFNLFNILKERKKIDFETYEQLHRRKIKQSIIPPKNEFILAEIERTGPKEGFRHYAWVE